MRFNVRLRSYETDYEGDEKKKDGKACSEDYKSSNDDSSNTQESDSDSDEESESDREEEKEQEESKEVKGIIKKGN